MRTPILYGGLDIFHPEAPWDIRFGRDGYQTKAYTFSGASSSGFTVEQLLVQNFFFPPPPVIVHDLLVCTWHVIRKNRFSLKDFLALEPSVRVRVCLRFGSTSLPLSHLSVAPSPFPRFLSLCADLFLSWLFADPISPHPFVRNATAFKRKFQRCQQSTAWETPLRSTSGRSCQAFLSTAARATDEFVLPIRGQAGMNITINRRGRT